MASTTTFPVPQVPANPESWGPPTPTTTTPDSTISKFQSLPYAPFGRSDRLGRAADFSAYATTNAYSRSYLRGRTFGDHSGVNTEFQYKVQEDDFELVDTAKTTNGPGGNRGGGGGGRFSGMGGRQRNNNRLRNLNARHAGGRDGGGYGGRGQFQRTRRGQTGGGGRYGGRGGGGRYGGRGGRYRDTWRERVDRQASVAIKTDWKLVMDMDLGKVSKGISNTARPKTEEDLLWCGFLDRYNEFYDKCSTRSPKVLKRYENKLFYPVSTMDDPVIEKFAIEGKGNVFATDAILAHLMTCPRSVYPWDIVVQKLPGSGAIFFDRRDDSQFDYLTVNETANNPPSNTRADDDPEGINTPERLSLESTAINHNFSQQILKTTSTATRKSFDLPNPFYDEEDNDGMEPASCAFRYRKFDLGDGIEIVCRTELHGVVKKKSVSGSVSAPEEQYTTAFALNEYFDSVAPYSKTNVPSQGLINWREKLDTQRGAVLATELKNNAFKLAKWTAQSILADADQMKIGFVSRTTPKNPYEHVILGTQFYRPKDFATQITLNEGSMWGIMRMLIGIFKDQPEGKYVLMRNPNKAELKIYAVPQGTFESDEGESD